MLLIKSLFFLSKGFGEIQSIFLIKSILSEEVFYSGSCSRKGIT